MISGSYISTGRKVLASNKRNVSLSYNPSFIFKYIGWLGLSTKSEPIWPLGTILWRIPKLDSSLNAWSQTRSNELFGLTLGGLVDW